MNAQYIKSRVPLCLLAWCVLATCPTLAQTITHVPLFTFDGDSADDLFGYSVSGAGDVNGDGAPDLIVGGFGIGEIFGYARVFSGADGSVLYTFNGGSGFDHFGLSVSGAGDVNGDGFDDLIVGAPGDDNNGLTSGSARVFSGADGSVLYNLDRSGLLGFGSSVSSAGDVNGDGVLDLIVGASGDDNVVGSARVFSGVDGSVLHTFVGNSAGDNFGRSVSDAGDVNGDGFDDLIVGAMTDATNGRDSGNAKVFSGADGSVLYNFDFDDISFGDLFGSSVSSAGDVNGDGFADVIVGALSDRNNGSASGSARVLSGADGSVLYIFNGATAFTNFGWSVSGLGDVNGDGVPDLIVGGSGTAGVFSGADGSALYNFRGDFSRDRFGASVSGVGDVNGDGLADFIVGASEGGANDGGYAKLFVSQITILGDCNLDGIVDFLDIQHFIAILSFATFFEQADCNEDGIVDFLDVGPFIAILAAQ